jgi:hypothetical protein
MADLLAGALGLAEDIAGRLAAAEEGRHPRLDDVRRALGDDFDVSGAIAAARAAWPAPGGGADAGADISDTGLAAAVDAAWLAARSTRLVRADYAGGTLGVARGDSPVSVRDGERLVLFVVGVNDTDEGIEFSAEAHGEGLGGFIEPRRAGSALFDAGEMHAGSYYLPVLVVAAGHAATLDVPIECRRS